MDRAAAKWSTLKGVCQAMHESQKAKSSPTPSSLFVANFAGLALVFNVGVLASQFLFDRPFQYYPELAWRFAEKIAPIVLDSPRLVALLPMFCYATIMISLALMALFCLEFFPALGYGISMISMLIFGLSLGAMITHAPLIGPLYLFTIVGAICHAVGRQQWLAWIGGTPALLYLALLAANGGIPEFLMQMDLFAWLLLPFVVALFGAIALFLGHAGASLTLALQQKHGTNDPQGYATATIMAQGTILLFFIVWVLRIAIARIRLAD